MDDLLNVGLRNVSLMMFDQALEEPLMKMEIALAVALLEGACYGQSETSTLMKNALGPYHSDQVHRTEVKCYTQLKAMVTGILQDPQQGAPMCQTEKGRSKDSAIPVVAKKRR